MCAEEGRFRRDYTHALPSREVGEQTDMIETGMGSENTLWAVMAAVLVVLGPAGLATYHMGLVRAKNASAVGVGRIADVVIAALLFWAWGSQLTPTVGEGGFLLLLRATLAASLVTAAAAERLRIRAHLVVVVVFSLTVYPLFQLLSQGGWLAHAGLVDLGGALGVHALGGAAALGAALATGARAGRLARGGGMVAFEAGHAPLAVLGAVLFLLALVGLAGGPSPLPVLHLLLGAAAGGIAAFGGAFALSRTPEPLALARGALAGAIALSAGAAFFPTALAPVCGVGAGLVVVGLDRLLETLRIDDATSTVAVHVGGGVWGSLALALLGDVSLIGRTRGDLIAAHLLGIGVVLGAGFACGWGVLKIVSLFGPIKVTRDQEREGLALSEHHVPSEAAASADLAPDEVRIDVREEAPVEPFFSAARVTFGPEGMILASNPLTSAIFGYSQHELVGLDVTALFAPRTQDGAAWDLPSLTVALAGGKHTTYGVTRTGEEVLVEAQLLTTNGEVADTLVLREVDHPHFEGLSHAQIEIQDRLARELADTQMVPSRDLPADALLPGGEVAARVSAATPWFGYYYDPKGETVTFYAGEVLAEGGAASLLSAIAGSSYGSDYTHGLLLGNPKYPIDRQLRNLAEVLNRIVLQTGKGEIHIGMSFLHVQLGNGEAVFLSAGARTPLLVKSVGKLRELEGSGTALGVSTDPDFAMQTLTLIPGDIVVAWSAGMIDTFGDAGEAFSMRDLKKLVGAHEDTRALRDAMLAKATDVLGDEEESSALVFRFVPR
jgi:ammonia channel protein AmtB